MSSRAVTILSPAEAHFARGETLALLHRWPEAAEAYGAAAAARPGYPEAWNRRGSALYEIDDFDEALACFEAALQLRPDFPEALASRGSALWRLDRPADALASADRALACDPSCWAAHTVRGNALRNLGRIGDAIAAFDRVIAAVPGNAVARLNRALCWLLSGDLEPAWPEYELRWQMATHRRHAQRFDEPLWLGREPVQGKTVLLHPEQGLGDTIQFCRYAALLAERGATVLLEAAPALHGVLASVPGVSRMVARADPALQFDLQCPLLSLPLAFQTRLDSIPSQPYLTPPPEHRRKWHARLGPARGMRIGVAWSGNAEHRNDRNRSLPLASVATMLPPGVEVFCLQREIRSADVPALAALPHLRFFGSELADFSDTAALAAEMDLVIAVDTAVLHLAGALGLPVWGLLPFACDWRWLLGRADTPWYPTMRLFRQPALDDWNPVLAEVRRLLMAQAAGTWPRRS